MSRLLRFVARHSSSFAVLCLVFMCVYFLVRAIALAFLDYTPLDRLMALLLLAAETHILIHAFGFFVSVLASEGQEPIKDLPLDDAHAPSVAVIVAARHEPRAILEQTMTTFHNLLYPNKAIYLLNDSTEEKYIAEAQALAERFGIKLFWRQERHGAKAGIINDFLKTAQEKYVAIFDADQNPMPDFLRKTIPLLENDERLGFVQTPQFYSNLESGPVPEGAAMQQAIFYETICEGKSGHNAMFCCGTNVVFRRQALAEVGGFDEGSVTEDFATSVKLHRKGYRSLYYNHVAVFGMAPETLPAYFKQQSRWATGNIGIFFETIRSLFEDPASLTPFQWLEYLLAGSWYFTGWVFFVLMCCPILFLLMGIPSFFLDARLYLASFLPYLSVSWLVYYTTLSKRRYTLRQLYYGMILSFLSFPVLMRAAVLGLLGLKVPFVITTKGTSEVVPWWRLWPYFVMLGLNAAALVAGCVQFHRAPWPVSSNMFWCLYHMSILLQIFHFNRPPRLEPAPAEGGTP